jgi:hypothetical protein
MAKAKANSIKEQERFFRGWWQRARTEQEAEIYPEPRYQEHKRPVGKKEGDKPRWQGGGDEGKTAFRD